jgi:hypothetical protein
MQTIRQRRMSAFGHVPLAHRLDCPNWRRASVRKHELTTNRDSVDDPHSYTAPRRPMFVKRWSKTDRSVKEFRNIGLKDRKLND